MAEDKEPVKKATKPINSSDKPLFYWKSPDMIQEDRSATWYLFIVGFAVVLGGVLYWQQLWTGAALVALAAVILLISSRLKPKEVECALFPEGVVVNDAVYEYSEFKSFWVSETELPKIKLQRIGRIAGQVDMPAMNADLDKLRAEIVKHLPEEADKGEDLVDTINRIIRF